MLQIVKSSICNGSVSEDDVSDVVHLRQVPEAVISNTAILQVKPCDLAKVFEMWCDALEFRVTLLTFDLNVDLLPTDPSAGGQGDFTARISNASKDLFVTVAATDHEQYAQRQQTFHGCTHRKPRNLSARVVRGIVPLG